MIYKYQISTRDKIKKIIFFLHLKSLLFHLQIQHNIIFYDILVWRILYDRADLGSLKTSTQSRILYLMDGLTSDFIIQAMQRNKINSIFSSNSYFLHDAKLLQVLIEGGLSQVNGDFCRGQVDAEQEREHHHQAPHQLEGSTEHRLDSISGQILGLNPQRDTTVSFC